MIVVRISAVLISVIRINVIRIGEGPLYCA